ncbi:MAG: galactokinase family protein, partial [Clostridiales bacterium]|nr:galactokinase family protein [Clostridiales bacterium]
MLTIQQLTQNLNDGVYDERLAYIYCRKPEQAAPFRARVLHVAQGYAKTFGKDDSAQVAIYSAPGRTEIGGNHTDHQQGKVLTGSVDL